MDTNSPTEPAPTIGRAFNLREVAAHFGVAPRTVQLWMKQRLISYVKIGAGRRALVRFDAEDIDAFKNRLRRQARA